MNSALKLIAFSDGCKVKGIEALLEAAIEALDQNGDNVSAALVEMALGMHLTRSSAVKADTFEGLSELG